MTGLPKFAAWAATAALTGALAGCGDGLDHSSQRAYQPLSSEMQALMTEKGAQPSSPILIRAYKKEAELEIWKMRSDGQYTLLKTYPMCRWSGQLGPKTREGDRQVPEGFYNITPGQMNPQSAYYLSFNVGYPNALDRALGHKGGSIMVHGACSSAGCFSMTDKQIAEIYTIAREAFGGGQRAIQMQSFPFRMTAQNLAKHRLDPNMAFWKNLKEGSDYFEVTKQEPRVAACGRHYVFDAQAPEGQTLDAAAPCPVLKEDGDVKARVAEKEQIDARRVAELSKTIKPVRVLYADGGQNPHFASQRGEDVSRPDALVQAPTEIALDEPVASKPAPAAHPASPKAMMAKLPHPKPAPFNVAHAKAAGQSVAARAVEPAAAPVSSTVAALAPIPEPTPPTSSIGRLLSKLDPRSKPAPAPMQLAPTAPAPAAEE
ncbi:MAG: murein L,D-transpeptidase [Hyphomicrobiales bacterium]|nr:murein L,D-transpeptidase [Hyphomicrobiales bacterium]